MEAWLILSLLFLILLAAGAVYFIIYYNIFGTVIVAPSIVGPLNGFCIEVNGSYHSIGSAIKAAEKTIQTTAPSVWKVVQYVMGVYYDNPQKVPAAQCRARICFVISVPTASLESSEEYKTLMKTLSAYSFTLPSTPSLIWHYPYKNWLSFPIGAYKFYSTLIKTHPDLEKKACDVGLQGSLELYRLDVTPPYILFAVPTVIDATLAKQVPLFKAYEIKKAQ